MPEIGGGVKMLWIVFATVNLLSIAWIAARPKAAGSIYHTDLHYIYNLGVMIFGAIVFLSAIDKKPRGLARDALLASLSFVLYFVLMKVGKGHSDWTYYVQLLAILPLYGFIYYAFRSFSHDKAVRLATMDKVKPVVVFISNLTLEIYLVQQYVITDRFNSVFPLNTVIVFFLICLSAYILHVMVGLFLNVMSGRTISWTSVLR